MKALRNNGSSPVEFHINGKANPAFVIEAGAMHNLSDQELRGIEAETAASPELQAAFEAVGNQPPTLVLLELDGHGRPIEASDDQTSAA